MSQQDALTVLESTLKELVQFSSVAVFQRNKDLFNSEIKKIEAEIVALKGKASLISPSSSKPLRVRSTLTEYAFDQSDKFVKIFIPFNTAGIKEDKVRFDVDANSLSVLIEGDEKDYEFVVRNLLKSVVVEGSFHKIKPDMISIYLKKANFGNVWECLTQTEKRLKDEKKSAFDQKKGDKEDPMGGLMSIMKNMYESGDPEMKRTIAKAWTEGQDKSKGSPMF